MADFDLNLFNLQINQWKARARAMPLLVAQEIIKDLNKEIVKNTPVRSGKLKNSYYASINMPPTGTPGGGGTMYEAVADRLKIGDVYHFGNVAPYAARMEFGFVGTDSRGRRYNQSGRYFMTQALARINAIAQTAANRVARRLGQGQPNPISGANMGTRITLP